GAHRERSVGAAALAGQAARRRTSRRSGAARRGVAGSLAGASCRPGGFRTAVPTGGQPAATDDIWGCTHEAGAILAVDSGGRRRGTGSGIGTVGRSDPLAAEHGARGHLLVAERL